jgi:hypothetical protein
LGARVACLSDQGARFLAPDFTEEKSAWR